MESRSRFASYEENVAKKEWKMKLPAKNTNYTRSYAVRLLKSYCAESKMFFGGSLCMIPGDELPTILKRFYTCARNEKGGHYKLNTMRSLRNSLQRYFLDFCKVDIIHDPRFADANTAFDNVLETIKSLGKGDTQHHPEIDPEDLRKLYASFNIDDPYGLQEIVWFNIMFIFMRRGRENLRRMTKDTFAVATDVFGKRFIYEVDGENETNRGALSNSPGLGRIYETADERCPVRTFELYISRLNPKLDALWQRPRQLRSFIKEAIWYSNVPHGENYLGGMMPMLSSKYELSQRYTNHCLQVTNFQACKNASNEVPQIIQLVGQEEEVSLQNCDKPFLTVRKRKISELLSQRFSESHIGAKIPYQRSDSENSDSEKVVILLDTTPDQSMVDEGIACEIISRIQQLREKANLVPTQEITIVYEILPDKDISAFEKLSEVVISHSEFMIDSIRQPLVPAPGPDGLQEIIREILPCKGAKLIIRILNGRESDVSTVPTPFCKFVNLQLCGMNPGSGVSGSHGTLLLENPRGDFVLTKEEFNRQVAIIFGLQSQTFLVSTSSNLVDDVIEPLSQYNGKTLYLGKRTK